MREKDCKYCGRSFLVPPTSPKQVYCARKCKDSDARKTPEFYSIPVECACGCGEVLYNPDNHFRYRKFIYGHGTKNGLHPRIGVKQSEEEVIKRTKSMLKHFREKEPTCLEKELYEYLTENGIEFVPQKQFGRTIPDAFVPKFNLAIYADGKYWHDRPEVKERDIRINKQMADKGLNVLRLKSIDNGYHLDLEPLKDTILAAA